MGIYVLIYNRVRGNMTVIIYIPIFRKVRGCVRIEQLKISKNKKPTVQYFWIIYLFCRRSTSVSPTGWPQIGSYYYIYLYIKVRGCVSAKRLRISKNAEIGVQYFCIIYLFCNRHTALSPTGWPQNVI